MSKSTLTIVVAAGGTGGHVIPGLAVANALQERGQTIHWLGTSTGIEARLVPEAGLPLHLIKISGFRGKGLLAKLLMPIKLVGAVLQARRQLKALQADAVLAMGGFVAGPTGIAAKWLGVPVVVQEQNAVAGTTNRMLARWAKKVLTAFPQAFAGRGELLGNPVRDEIAQIPTTDNEPSMPLNLLVLGGSLGAQILNQTVPAAIALLADEQRPQVVHQCGIKNLAEAQAAYAQAGVTAEVTAYIDDMAAAYQQADFMVCRAGALTVAEVAAAGVAAVFVPLPSAIDDHQTANAKSLCDQDGGVLLPQSELSPERLAQMIREFNHQPSMLRRMGTMAQAQAKPQATVDIAMQVEAVAQQYSPNLAALAALAALQRGEK